VAKKRRSPSSAAPPRTPVSIGFVSLGCSKNLVDLQVMASELHQSGFDIGVEVDEADVIVVNTCAFIEDAREEAVSSILGACELKKSGCCKAVVVAGCLPQRYRERILKACPDVDALLGLDDLPRISDVVSQALGRRPGEPVVAVSSDLPSRLFVSKIPAMVLTGGPYAYLKVAEGCQHACAFCAIPGIRGKLRSRTIDDVACEARAILDEGVRELNLVAQDVTSYGRDLKDGTSLAKLLRRLDALKGDFWIRLLYGHPAMITDELLDVMASSRHVCRYLDIPIQHSHPDILRAMQRADTLKHVPGMAARLRARIPGVTLRTTCLVGFPGETQGHFEHLLKHAEQEAFDHLGVFAFSPEEGTDAFAHRGEADDIVAENRRGRLMLQQAKLVKTRLDAKVGTVTRVLLEAPPEDEDGLWEGRTEEQAPDDIDGVTYVADVPDTARPGDFINVEITGTGDYDLVASWRGQ
jgi:ribosomal protein S12 methylthiotransferase